MSRPNIMYLFAACMVSVLLVVQGKVTKTAKAREVPDGSNANANDLTTQKTVRIAVNEEVLRDCPGYAYCQGTLFPSSLRAAEKQVTCDQVPHPQDVCCLNAEPHLVCYNIQVEGLFLVYEPGQPDRDTDFSALCEQMVQAQNATMGRYTAITRGLTSGQIAYRYAEWFVRVNRNNDAQSYHIRDLACGILPKSPAT